MVDSTILVEKRVLNEEEMAIVRGTPQYVMVMNHLIRYGSITGNEARDYYGITRLPARIWEITNRYKLPVKIKSDPITQKNRFGKSVTFAKYILED